MSFAAWRRLTSRTVPPSAASPVAGSRKGEHAMRRIVAGLFMSMDGVVERPDQWTGPHFNEEIGQLVGSLIAGGDTLLLGRRTYQEFAEAFGGGTGGDPMEATMNDFPKVVVSTTLEKADWQNS